MAKLSELSLVADPLQDIGVSGLTWQYVPGRNRPEIVVVDDVTCLENTNGGIYLPTTNNLNTLLAGKSYTISCWSRHSADDPNINNGTNPPSVFSNRFVSPNNYPTHLHFMLYGRTVVAMPRYNYPSGVTEVPFDTWVHAAFSYDAVSNTAYYFYNGKLFSKVQNSVNPLTTDNAPFAVGFSFYSAALSTSTSPDTAFKGYLRQFEIHDEVLFTGDYNPSDYWESYSKNVYVTTSNSAYAENPTFGKVADSWGGLTDSQKNTVFQSVSSPPTTSNLSSLSPFHIEHFSDSPVTAVSRVIAVPHDQIVTQKKLYSTKAYERIRSVNFNYSLSGNASIKVAVTTNGTDYKAYDFQNKAWVNCNISSASEMDKTANNIHTVGAIPQAEWDKILSTNIGFAYLLSSDSLNDKCAVTQLSMIVDKKGSWYRAILWEGGNDANYEYVDSETLLVKFNSAGDYKINYNMGPV